jgi:hypothetical protein
MSNQEPQNPNNDTEQAAVEKRRRFIKGAGVASPVILTLASSSVFGQQLCLSQQLSGNTSGQATASCEAGHPPSWWADPAHIIDWTSAGFVYGTLKNGNPNPALCSSYKSDGTAFNSSLAFGTLSGCITNPPGQLSKTMQELMCTDSSSDIAVWSAAMLNTGLASAHLLNYVLTREQLLDLWVNHNPPSPFAQTCAGTLLFLKATMGL